MENNLPVITVIIPVYKVERYLKRCVESVLKQTYSNLEIILVDDGSPDNCPKMCDDYAKKDNRIKVIHKENGGLSDARNFGIKASSGEYITLLDSDDYLREDAIEIMYNRICEDDSDLAFCNYLCVDNNGNTDIFGNENSLPIQDAVLTATQAQHTLFGDYHWHYVIACAKLYKKSLFDDFEYPLGKLHEDLYTTHLIFEKCNKVSTIHEPLYYYYQNTQSITHVYSIKRLDAVGAYIERYRFFINKEDFYCANGCLLFMVEKLTKAHKNLKDEKSKEIIESYKAIFNELYDDFRKQNVEINKKKELDWFYDGFLKYKLYIAFSKKTINRYIYNLKVFVYKFSNHRSKNEKQRNFCK